jgi:hypothetical protein
VQILWRATADTFIIALAYHQGETTRLQILTRVLRETNRFIRILAMLVCGQKNAPKWESTWDLVGRNWKSTSGKIIDDL